jgi:uncharacterized protein
MHIGRVEGADMEVMKISAYLHDVGRPYQDASKGMVCHAEKGAEIVQALLEGYPISQERKDNIILSIRSHRFRGNYKPGTLEAEVLFDADKLDAIGAIGIGRAFQIKDRIYTPEGRRIAERRHAFMELFFERFLQEHEGC